MKIINKQDYINIYHRLSEEEKENITRVANKSIEEGKLKFTIGKYDKRKEAAIVEFLTDELKEAGWEFQSYNVSQNRDDSGDIYITIK